MVGREDPGPFLTELARGRRLWEFGVWRVWTAGKWVWQRAAGEASFVVPFRTAVWVENPSSGGRLVAARAVYGRLNARLDPRTWATDPASGLPVLPTVWDLELPELVRGTAGGRPPTGVVDLTFPWPALPGAPTGRQVPVRIKSFGDDPSSPGRLGLLEGELAPTRLVEAAGDNIIVVTLWPEMYQVDEIGG